MSEQLSLTPFEQLVQHATKNQRLPPPTVHLYRNELVFKYLPIIRTRPPSITTKTPYRLFINPKNIHESDDESERYQPLQKEITSTVFPKTHTQPRVLGSEKSYFPFNDVAYMYSPYGPTNFELTDTPFYPHHDRDFHTNPTLLGKTVSATLISLIHNVTKLAVGLNNVHSDMNNDLIAKTIIENQHRDPLSETEPKRPIITFSNHNTTMDDPFIIAKMHPTMTSSTARWEICGQDICYPTPLIAAGFIAGRVLPIQRGSGLHQPHFTRLHNLLSNGEWVHLFPEGKVQFTPTYDGLDHELTDPPAQLLPFKWGIGALVAETLLRGQVPVVIPVMHTSARVHPRSNGLPQFMQDSSILVGNDVVDQIKPMVDDYITQVYAYESNRWPAEPSKERLFADITARLKHISDGLYHNVENHQGVPDGSKLKQTLEKYRLGASITTPSEKQTQQKLDPETVRHHCNAVNCFCQHGDGFVSRQTYQQQLLFRDQISHRQVEDVMQLLQAKLRPTTTANLDSTPQNKPPQSIQPWFSVQSANEKMGKSKINDEELGPEIISNYLCNFQQFILTPTATKPELPIALREQSISNDEMSTLDPEQRAVIEQSNQQLMRSYQRDVALSQQLFSTHHIPRRLHVATNRYIHRYDLLDKHNYDLSMRVEQFLKPQYQWGAGKYNTGLDGVKNHEEAGGVESEDLYDPLGERIPSNRNWYHVWSDRNRPAQDEFFAYLPDDHSLVIDKASFEATWKEYLNLNYDKVTARLKKQLFAKIAAQDALKKALGGSAEKTELAIAQEKSTETTAPLEGTTPSTQEQPASVPTQLPPQLPPSLNKSAINDLTYLTEVFMLRNRFEVYRRSYGFDWNGV